MFQMVHHPASLDTRPVLRPVKNAESLVPCGAAEPSVAATPLSGLETADTLGPLDSLLRNLATRLPNKLQSSKFNDPHMKANLLIQVTSITIRRYHVSRVSVFRPTSVGSS